MKMFVPAVGYRIKLTQDWTFDLYHEHRNYGMLDALYPDILEKTNGHVSWRTCYIGETNRLKHTQVTLPAGSLLEVDRVYVRMQSKSATTKEDDYDSLTFKLVQHPLPGFSKKKLRFWAKLCDVNMIEYELPENFAEVKERAKAGTPKKLTPILIQEIVMKAINPYDYERDITVKPNWYTESIANDLMSFAAEYKRRAYENEAKRRDVEREQQIESARVSFDQIKSTLSQIPNNISIRLPTHLREPKTFEEYLRMYSLHDIVARDARILENDFKWKNIISNFFYRQISVLDKTTKDESNRLIRRWIGLNVQQKTRQEILGGRKRVHVDISDMWIEVVTNDDDTMIVDIKCGWNQ